MHSGDDKPRCTVCGMGIFGDEEYLPNGCPLTDDKRHVYPNGEKAPESIYAAYPATPEGHIMFHGLGLASPTGFCTDKHDLDVDLVEFLASLLDGEPDEGVDPREEVAPLWRSDVVAPLVCTYLLPLVPFEHAVAAFERGNPVRFTEITGRPLREVGEYERVALLNDVWVSFPRTAILNLASHYVPEAETGIPDAIAVPAYLAGLSADEVIERHANGTLDHDAVEVLRALQG
jgi:hypothetical protein